MFLFIKLEILIAVTAYKHKFSTVIAHMCFQVSDISCTVLTVVTLEKWSSMSKFMCSPFRLPLKCFLTSLGTRKMFNLAMAEHVWFQLTAEREYLITLGAWKNVLLLHVSVTMPVQAAQVFKIFATCLTCNHRMIFLVVLVPLLSAVKHVLTQFTLETPNVFWLF